MTENKKVEIIFVPGCFDNFEGTQEELDEMLNEIQRLVDTGEIFERSSPVEIDGLSDDDVEEMLEALVLDKSTTKRTLQ